jgi:SAM-dependent methyltransferase
VLEAGAGPGLFKPHARKVRPDLRWIALDLIHAPWNEVVADAQVLPFGAASFDAVVGLDFIHHLATPLEFFKDVARVLKPGGELRVVEPWVSPFSYPIYRFFHQEGATLGLDSARPFQKGDLKEPFEGDAGVTRSIRSGVNDAAWRRLGFAAGAELTKINGFAYLLSFGFKPPSLLPRFLAAPVIALDRLLPARLTAMRVELRARKRL